MKFLDGASAKHWVRKRIAAGIPGTLAVAFWGRPVHEELGFTDRAKVAHGKMTVICNLRMGGTNPKCLGDLRSIEELKGLELKQSDRLHGKVYLFEGDVDEVMIGSSNASNGGMLFEQSASDSWAEANIVTDNKQVVADVKTWIGRLHARNISPTDEKQALERFKTRPPPELFVSEPFPVERLLANHARSIEDQPIFVAVYGGDFSEKGEDELAKQKKAQGKKIEMWEDWPGLVRKGLLICFYKDGVSGRTYYEGIYERDPAIESSNEKRFQLCIARQYSASLLFNLKNPKDELDVWKRLANNFVMENPQKYAREEGIIKPLCYFRKFIELA